MIKLSPIARLSMGLVFLTISIFLAADLVLGLNPFDASAEIEARKKLAESLAVQFSELAARDEIVTIEKAMVMLERRNEDILSAALRTADGFILAEVGDHRAHWVDVESDRSTPTHTQIPIYEGDTRWGTVELRFASLGPSGVMQILLSPYLQLIVFISVVGFVGYLMYLRRSLKHLDPSAVIPSRVKVALDALAEGVVLMDASEQIVLVNDAFAHALEETSTSLMGRSMSELDWVGSTSDGSLPWRQVILDGQAQTGIPMSLATGEGEDPRTLMVNVTPILDDKGNRRGALATFDDVTELEQKNTQLKEMLKMLEESRDDVRRKNEKLQVLATRDPLTACLNRRTFFEKLEAEFAHARTSGQTLSCIMADIDHFKSVNDDFGHATGDQVIKQTADLLRSGLRTIDLIGRYGGEEFCISLPGADLSHATEIAERVRSLIEANVSIDENLAPVRQVTVSIGVTSTDSDATDAAQLVDHADQALYASKNAGRNRVTRYCDLEAKEVAVG